MGGAHVRAAGAAARAVVPARLHRRRDSRRLLRPARCEPRRVLPLAAPEPPARLVDGQPARLQQLRVAGEAQRRSSHVHERRRIRRRHQPDAVRADAPVTAGEAVVPPAARVRLAALHGDADPLADRRGHRCSRSRADRQQRDPVPRRWDLAGLLLGKAIFIGWAIVVPLLFYPWWVVAIGYVGFAMVASLVTATTFQLAHCVEEAASASPDETGGDEARSGRCTRSSRPSTSAPATSCSPGSSAASTSRSSTTSSRGSRTRTTRASQRSSAARRAEHGVRYTAQPSLRVAIRSHQRHLRALGRVGRAFEIEMG